MPGSADETGAAEDRPLLFSIADGMTGAVGDSENIMQDAFLGLTRARQVGTTIADPKVYLTTPVTRRETYVRHCLPEPFVAVGSAYALQ